MPSTSNSELTKRLKVRLAEVPGPIGTSVKVVERPGAKIHLGIANNNTSIQEEDMWKDKLPTDVPWSGLVEQVHD